MNVPSKNLEISSHFSSTGSSRWNHGGLCVGEAASDQLTSCLRRGWAEQRPSFYKRAHYPFFLLISQRVRSGWVSWDFKGLSDSHDPSSSWWEHSGCQPWSWESSMWFFRYRKTFQAWQVPEDGLEPLQQQCFSFWEERGVWKSLWPEAVFPLCWARPAHGLDAEPHTWHVFSPSSLPTKLKLVSLPRLTDEETEALRS